MLTPHLLNERKAALGSLAASAGNHGWSYHRGDGNDNLVAAEQIVRPINASLADNPPPADPRHHPRVRHGVRGLTPLECERSKGLPTAGPACAASAHIARSYVVVLTRSATEHSATPSRRLWWNESADA
jgi:hypothetical protein